MSQFAGNVSVQEQEEEEDDKKEAVWSGML